MLNTVSVDAVVEVLPREDAGHKVFRFKGFHDHHNDEITDGQLLGMFFFIAFLVGVSFRSKSMLLFRPQ